MFLIALGITFLLYIIYLIAYAVYTRLLRAPTSYKEFAGTWALVTGSSYGTHQLQIL